MKSQLCAVVIGALVLSCGDNDLESASKFISKTQEEGEDIKKFTNAFLINKVHAKSDHNKDRGENDRTPPNNLTVHVNVGYWYGITDEDRCSNIQPRIWQVHTTPTARIPEGACNVRYCVSAPANAVNAAINQWLEPLRGPYDSDRDPIVSGDFVTTNTKSDSPDLIINFVCGGASGASWPWPTASPNGDCPSSSVGGQSCTRYGTSERVATPIANNNIPIIYIGNGPRPYAGPNIQHGKEFTLYDRIPGHGSHDHLDLLHELGHAFGLADTHEAFGVPKDKQPLSIMNGNRPATGLGSPLQLSQDDKKGVQWLYEHHRRDVAETNCFFPEYTSKTNSGTHSCEPSNSLLQTLLDKKPQQALKLLRENSHSLKINAKTTQGESALHLAIRDYSAPDLSTAARNDYLEVIRTILRDARSDPNLQDDIGRTPLHLAVQLDHPLIVTLLLASPKLSVIVQDDDQETALHVAARNGLESQVAALQHAYASHSSIKNDEGKTAFHLAAEEGHEDSVRNFADYPDFAALIAVKDNANNTALHLAAANGHVEVIKEMFREGGRALINETNRRHATALHLAAKKRAGADTVSLLLTQTGIEVNGQDEDGNTPLHLAALNGNADSVEWLLNAPDINTALTNDDNNTARDEAVRVRDGVGVSEETRQRASAVVAVFDGGGTRFGTSSAQRLLKALNIGRIEPADCTGLSETELTDCRRNVASVIINEGENLNINYVATDTGNTALHVAVSRAGLASAEDSDKYEMIIDLLLRQTLINPNIKNKAGDAPLHLAVRSEKQTIVRLILRHPDIDGNNPARRALHTPLHIAVERENVEIIGDLLRCCNGSIDVNLHDRNGIAPLHLAIKKRNEEITQALVDDRNIDVNLRTRDSAQETALHIAARSDGSEEIIETLLRNADIDVNITDASGDTALHIAAHRGADDVVEKLLNAPGIDLEARNGDDETAYEIAQRRQRTAVITVFEENPHYERILRGTFVEVLRDESVNQEKAIEILRTEKPNVNEKDRQSGNTALHYAIKLKWRDLIAELLKRSDLQVNNKNGEGETALHTATVVGDISVLNAVLDRKGISVNARDGDGDTALLVAVKGQQQSVVTALLGHREIDVDVKGGDGNTALHIAVTNKYNTLISTLLRVTSINVNIKTKSGDTPLHLAVRGGDTDTIAKLLAHTGIRVNEKNNSGDTALLAAVRAKTTDVVTVLLNHSGIDVNAKNTAGNAPLHIAVRNNDRDIVTALLQNQRIDVNILETASREENTPLHLAIKQHLSSGQSHIRVILLLLGHRGIRPNTKNQLHDSPLMIAVKDEDNTLVSNLLQYRGVDANTADSRQKTALMYAAERDSRGIVQRLLASNADVNLQDSKKFTALHFAAHNGHVAIVRLLVEVGDIDLTLEDRWGLTARERASNRGHDDIVALIDGLTTERERAANAVSILAELARGDSEAAIMEIIDRGNIKVNAVDTDNENYTALHYAAGLGYERVVRALMGYDDIRVNAVDSATRTALHIATAGNHLGIVRALLEHRSIYAKAKTSDGQTALHYAAQLGHSNIVRVLLDSDESLVNVQTYDQRTALHYACWLGHRAVVTQLLQEDDINLDLKNANGDTALHIVATYNRLPVARMLLENGANPSVVNKQQKTARAIAWDSDYTEMVKLIEQYRN